MYLFIFSDHKIRISCVLHSTAVDRIMPEQEKRFQEEVQKHVEEQSQNRSVLTFFSFLV